MRKVGISETTTSTSYLRVLINNNPRRQNGDGTPSDVPMRSLRNNSGFSNGKFRTLTAEQRLAPES
jgi:hypothetical protein